MKLRELEFPRTSETVDPMKLNQELSVLPDLKPWRDGLGNLQASYWIKFNDAGELVLAVPEGAKADTIKEVVEAHDPAPADDVQRGVRMRERIVNVLEQGIVLADKIEDGSSTPAERLLALEMVLRTVVRLARLQLRELDEEA